MTDALAIGTKLDQLRTELADLAFALECQGRLDAADVAMAIRARVGELCETLGTTRPDALCAPDECASPSRHYAG